MVVDLGRYGIWRHASALTPELAVDVEKLGYGAIWIGGSPPGDLRLAEDLLEATDRIAVATGIINIWSVPAAEAAASYRRVGQEYPGRFLLGIGIGHPESSGEKYRRPYETTVAYLDELDANGVPVEGRVLAALGPRMLRLAAARTAGAHPYLTTPRHTREAREILGTGKLLAPEQKVVLSSDPDRARSIARPAVENPYLHLVNYRRNLLRLGFSEADLDAASDAVIDALVAHGEPATVAARINEHLGAGADHVCAQVLVEAGADPLPAYRELAKALGLG
ncbi:LLM class F420-dependent oxidoreductase [Pseudonocardia acidicola]|uniref:LLM class F420-dependent oxidoreductase n=1 Tax=Pseudonocardia acidicola TaxID=2724939 RepID=A0ABX1SEQ1_9PSEU|nr:LLM class F420-dependent oxidoreductase [Pseudonocardia acidicola]NMH99389.1 LLM class F420-dependent oxidoreductase [Pseudonocardia acidicola]